MNVSACPVPQRALMAHHVAQPVTYTDCFSTVVDGHVSLQELIRAFYTTPLFRAERAVLALGLRRIIRDRDVSGLAGGGDEFAVWRVEARSDDQILLADISGRTKSWLCVDPPMEGQTRIYFGSVVVPVGEPPRLGAFVTAFMGLHVAYSKALLKAAAKALGRRAFASQEIKANP